MNFCPEQALHEMNTGRWIVALLLLLNAGVLALFWRQRTPAAPIPATVPATRGTADTKPRPGSIVTRKQNVYVTNDFNWARLETSDYREFIARLRAIGCPEETIRDLVIADIEKAYAPRLKALYPQSTNLSYWRPEEEELLNNVNHQAIEREQRAVDLEKRKAIKDLVGADLFNERQKIKGQTDYFERRLRFLPEEKRESVREVLEKYHDLDWGVRQKQWEEEEALTPEDRARLKTLRQEKETALAGLMTEEERQQFDLWMSPAADATRSALFGMDASEPEFLSVYKLRQAFEAQWDRDALDLTDPNVSAQWDQAKQQLETQIKAALGDQRYALYERGKDLDFHELSALATRYQLPADKAAEVYGMKTALQSQRQQVTADASLTPDQRREVLNAINQETERTIRAALGERAFRYYTRRADWWKQ